MALPINYIVIRFALYNAMTDLGDVVPMPGAGIWNHWQQR